MSEIANSVSDEVFTGGDDALELRVLRVMMATVVIAVIAAAIFASWRVTTGLMLGGVLSLLNYHWLRTSMAAVFRSETAGKRPRVRIFRYVIRYFVIGAVVIAAYKLNSISLPATIAGLTSFVVAFFVEAVRQSYFAIIRREEAF